MDIFNSTRNVSLTLHEDTGYFQKHSSYSSLLQWLHNNPLTSTYLEDNLFQKFNSRFIHTCHICHLRAEPPSPARASVTCCGGKASGLFQCILLSEPHLRLHSMLTCVSSACCSGFKLSLTAGSEGEKCLCYYHC